MINGVIIQARLSSSRLPNKVIKKLPYNSELTVLEQVINRCRNIDNIDNIIVATTLNDEDDKIEEISLKNGLNCFRGSTDNVLERFYLSAKKYNLDNIIRITSDCPCIDYRLISKSLIIHINERNDYTTNCIFRTFPHGLDFEIINFNSIEKAYFNASKDYEKEHVTPYIHTTKKNYFKIKNIYNNIGNFNKIRITLDTEEDYALICIVYDFLYYKNKLFGLEEIVKLFEEKPYLNLINKRIFQKKIFNSINEEKQEAINLLKLNEFKNIANFLENQNL